jgi:hypothetical protein
MNRNWIYKKDEWSKPNMCGEVITVQLRDGTTKDVIVDHHNENGRINVKLVDANDVETHPNEVVCWVYIGMHRNRN